MKKKEIIIVMLNIQKYYLELSEESQFLDLKEKYEIKMKLKS